MMHDSNGHNIVTKLMVIVVVIVIILRQQNNGCTFKTFLNEAERL